MYLFVQECCINSSGDFPSQDESFNIRELHFLDCYGAGWSSIFELVPRCSRLTSIALKFIGCSEHSNHRLRFSKCQELAKISILKLKIDQELANILDSCPKALSELAVVYCVVGERTIKACQRHFGTLVTFRLVGVRNYMVSNRSYWMENRARMDTERKLTEAVIRSSPKLTNLECPQQEAAALFPGKTGHGIWRYESKPSIWGSLGLKTLKFGAMNRNAWTDNQGPRTLVPLPAMEMLEEVVFSVVVYYDSYMAFIKPDDVLCPGGDFARSQVEQDLKLR